MTKYRSTKVVTIEPLIEHDWILSQQYIPGVSLMMKDGYRKGFKITDIANGKVSWMAKEEFEKEFVVEVSDDG